MENGKWTLEEVEKHIKANSDPYGSAAVVAALFLKLYGRLPKIGLSGFQAGAAESIADQIPNGVEVGK